MSTDDWLQTLNIKKGSGGFVKRRSKRGSLDGKRRSEGLTLQKLKQHEALLPYKTTPTSHWLEDGGSSVFSCDQDGFFTSMHKDSGLSKSQVDISELDTSVSDYGSATIDSAMRKKSREKRAKRNQTLIDKLKTGPNTKKKTPPPPPMRTTSNKNNLSSNRRSLRDSHFVSSTSTINSTDSGSGALVHKADPPSVLNESVVSESDTEAICARLKVKTSICSSGIPMMVSVTPCGSDEEDTEMLDYKNTWRKKHQIYTTVIGSPKVVPVSVARVNSINSAQHKMQSIQESEKGEGGLSDRSLDDSVIPSDTSLEWAEMDGYSTWPRSPKSPRPQQQKPNPPKTLNFNPVTPNKKQKLPEPKTPDENLSDKRKLTSFDSFKDPKSTPSSQVTTPYGTLPLPEKTVQSPKAVQSPAVSSPSSHYAVSPVSSSSTWPRKKSLAKSPSKSEDEEEIPIDTSTFPRPMEKMEIRSTRLVTPPSTLKLVAEPAKTVKSPESVTSPVPLPAAARLIISSPVANRAEYIENPHKRSLCSPVTEHDMAMYGAYSTEDKWYNTLPRNTTSPPPVDLNQTRDSEEILEDLPPNSPKIVTQSSTFEFGSSAPKPSFEFKLSPDSAFKPISSPIYPDLDSMKHSIDFPGTKKKELKPNATPSSYGRSWYDGVEKVSSPVPTEVTPVRRGSNASSISTNSSSSGKKSVTFASIHKSSLSSLDTGSVSSGRPEDVLDENATGLKRSVSNSSALSQASSSSGSSAPANDTSPNPPIAPKPHVEPIAKRQKTGTVPIIKPSQAKQQRPRLIAHGQRQRAAFVAQHGSMVSSSIPENQMWMNTADKPTEGPHLVRPVESLISPGADVTEGKAVVNVTNKTTKQDQLESKQAEDPGQTQNSDNNKPAKVNLQTFAPKTDVQNSTVQTSKILKTFSKPVSSPMIMTTFSKPVSSQSTTTSSSHTFSICKPASLQNSTSSSNHIFTISKPVPAAVSSSTTTAVTTSKTAFSAASTTSKTAFVTTAATATSKPVTVFTVPSTIATKTQQAKSTAVIVPTVTKPSVATAVTSAGNSKSTTISQVSSVPRPSEVQKPKATSATVSSPTVQASTPASPESNSVTVTVPKAASVTSAFTPLLTASIPVSSPSKPGVAVENLTVKSSPRPPKFVLPKLRAYGTKTSLPSSPKLTNASVTTSSKISSEPISTTSQAFSAAVSVVTIVSTSSPAVLAEPSAIASKPPLPVSSTHTKPSFNRSLSSKSHEEQKALSGSSTSLNQFSGTGLSRFQSNGSLAKSLTNLTGMSLPGNNLLGGSRCSLATSNDSLASNSSVHAERTRAQKMAFLTTNDANANTDKPHDPFAKFSLGQKKLNASRTSLASVKENVESNPGTSSATSSPKSAVQGRFVNSIISRFEDSSDSNPSLNGSTPNTPKASTEHKYQFTVPVRKNSTEKAANVAENATSPRDQLLIDIKNHRRESLTNGIRTNPPKQEASNTKSSNGIVGILDTMKAKIQTLPNKKRASYCSVKSLGSSQEWE